MEEKVESEDEILEVAINSVKESESSVGPITSTVEKPEAVTLLPSDLQISTAAMYVALGWSTGPST